MDRRAWIIFIGFVAIYGASLRGHIGSRDEEALYMTTVMLVKRVEATIGVAWTGPEPGDVRVPVFPSYEVGQPALAIPFYLLGDLVADLFPLAERTYVTRFVITGFGVLVTAATVAGLYVLGRQVGYGPRTATWTAAAYGLGTLAWPYSRTFFRDPLVALALLGAVLALMRWRTDGGRRLALLAAAWVALGVTAKFTTLILVPALVVYALTGPAARGWRRGARQPRSWGTRLGAAGIVLLAIGVLALGVGAKWEELRGHFYTVVFALEGTGTLDYVGRAFYGLTLSPGKGLVEFAPPVLGGLAGLPLLARRHRAEAWLCAGAAGLLIGAYSFNTGWHGGACWGPRYLLPVLPLLVLPLGALGAWLWAQRRQPLASAGGAVLGLVLLAGGVVQVAGIAVDPIHYYLSLLGKEKLTFESGPNYLQEIHFDPRLSPIPGHLGLLARDLETLAAGRTNFAPVPYEPVLYWQYFQNLAAPDFAWIHLWGWQTPGGISAAVTWHEAATVVPDAAAGIGAAVTRPAETPGLLIGTNHERPPSGPYRVAARLRRGDVPADAVVATLVVQDEAGMRVTRPVRASDLPADGSYGTVDVAATLDYVRPSWVEVQSSGVTTVALDRVWIRPAGPVSALPLRR